MSKLKVSQKIIISTVIILMACVLLLFARELWTKKASEARIAEIYTLTGLVTINDFHEKIDLAREAVHNGSIHNANDEFYKNWKSDQIDENFLKYLKNELSQPPSMECTSRSGLLGRILRHAGYQVRDVVVYNVNNNLTSHTFIEVQNLSTGLWEAQDPDFNIYWRNISTGQRASYANVLSDFKAYEPCFMDGCGWEKLDRNQRSLERFRSDYKIASFIDRVKNERFSVHAADVKENTVYTYDGKTESFCDLISKNCRQGFTPATGTAP
jgi:hypothetical protein